MQLAIVENNTVVKTGFYKDLFPNVSFPVNGPDKAWMTENNLMEVTYWKEHNRETQKLVPVEPYIEGDWVYTVQVAEKTPEDLEAERLAKRVMKVSMRQARLALFQKGLLDSVETAIQNIQDTTYTDPVTNEEVTIPAKEVQITWEYATEVDRNNKLVIKLQELLGWTDDQMDELFALAATL